MTRYVVTYVGVSVNPGARTLSRRRKTTACIISARSATSRVANGGVVKPTRPFRLRNPAVAIVSGLLAFGPVVRIDARQTRSASEILDIARGSFLFSDPAANRPITVWFCRPPTIIPDTRILFVMHGSESETARRACEIASPYVQSLNVIVLAPQFSEQSFPGDAYMFGNMIDPSGRARPKRMWALTVIERLFDLVRDTTGLTRPEYDIVGFSGGAQFVHRLVLFVPEARFRRAIAAGAGRYAFPSWSARFPYGLAGSPATRAVLPKVLSRDFVVLLGDRDTSDREREPGAAAQGASRFARGLRFFAAAADEATALQVPLRWELRIAHGLDHSPAPMVQAALDLLRR